MACSLRLCGDIWKGLPVHELGPHSAKLVSELRKDDCCVEIALEKRLGETLAPEHESPKWRWPSR
jgi:hypothetical protein